MCPGWIEEVTKETFLKRKNGWLPDDIIQILYLSRPNIIQNIQLYSTLLKIFQNIQIYLLLIGFKLYLNIDF